MNYKSTEWKNSFKNEIGSIIYSSLYFLKSYLMKKKIKNISHSLIQWFGFSLGFFWDQYNAAPLQHLRVYLSAHLKYPAMEFPYELSANKKDRRSSWELVASYVAPQNCPKVLQGFWHEQISKCSIISCEVLTTKQIFPFSYLSAPFFKFSSPSSPLRRGQKQKEISATAAKVTTYVHSTQSKLLLGRADTAFHRET